MKRILGCAFTALLFLASCSKDDDKKVVKYKVDTQQSYIEWTGYNPALSNYGKISVKDDLVLTKDGVVTGGKFTIPLSSIVALSQTGTLKEQLEHHLKSDDFFNEALYPSLTFNIKSVKPASGDLPGIDDANYDIKGDLTILGKPLEIIFPAKISIVNNQLNAEALITIDRLLWGMTYGSDPSKPQEYVEPDIDLHLILKANKQ
jgi:polyisoprenoid-binding protein YceI